MNNKILLAAIVLLALGAGAVVLVNQSSQTKISSRTEPQRSQPVTQPTQSTHSEQSHAVPAGGLKIPAYQTASEAKNLPPTLSPAKFIGKAKEAYQVAQEIPRTLAQLPCYCHCDQSFGHKSLHSCFVDDHAAHCAVCVDEALLAYQLERVEKMTPDQVRARIVEKYSADHQH